MSWNGGINPYESPRPIEEKNKRAKSRPPRRKWTSKEIYETVVEVLVDALDVDPEEVTPEASLVRDLGAE